MIRYIDLSDQIEEDANQFSFFDTTTGKYLEFEGQQVFDYVEHFKECYRDDRSSSKPSLERLLGLMPILTVRDLFGVLMFVTPKENSYDTTKRTRIQR